MTTPHGKLWGGRFAQATDALLEAYSASEHYDRRLYAQDIRGSQAHARMLGRQGVLSNDDVQAIVAGLDAIRDEIDAGEFPWDPALEDVHMNIEARLTARIGDAGKRLHTGRSRNDQVATDIRLYLREAVDELLTVLRGLRAVLVDLAEREADTIFPGYTHLQSAQPVTAGHHLLAWEAMFSRDCERLTDLRRRINRSPLGAAALAGTSYAVDRESTAAELGFDAVIDNSLDAVSDRDFTIEFCSAASLLMMHFSRVSEELVLWANPQFGMVALPDAFCTGSSIMPQKKNPDVAELARGKTGRVYGALMALLTLMKGQPLAYNRDNQEDKEPLFDALDTALATSRIMAAMLADLRFVPEKCRAAATQGYPTATELADYLVRKGVPFRDAHEQVGKTVALAVERGIDLADLPLADIQRHAPLATDDVFAVLTLEGAVAARDHIGGCAPAQVRAAAARARDRLARDAAD
ncbi:MAG: argininosuccinate lyase [Oceanococcaceae bacterium]